MVWALMFSASKIARAEALSGINFENPTYILGDINGQDGWIKTGAYDVAVVSNIYGYASFGLQTLRMSDAVTSGSFGDQTFSKSLADEAGETDALNNGMSGGTRQPHFEAQFDLASVMSTQQSGMHVSVSPDRGDGARMSYLRFEDGVDGINVFFDDVQGITNPANFVETQVGTDLSRSVPHTIKFVMDLLDGPSNDVVKIYIDNVLVHTGTSWENYYRFDSESNPSLESNSRTVDSLLFRESGTANLANNGNGYLVDNVSLFSGPIPVIAPQKVDICHVKGKKGTYQLINVSVNAKQAHLNHGDKVPGVDLTADCSAFSNFSATDSEYYNGLTPAAGLYGTGPISFTWDPSTGFVTSGYYTELVGGVTYYNIVTSGSVIGNSVNLTFDRTLPNVYHFTFAGTLVGNVLTGLMDGPYLFTAIGN